MFDYVTGMRKTERSIAARSVSGTITVLFHIAVIIAIVAVVYAVDEVPEVTDVPDVIAFTAPEPVPPTPPPPPPAAPAAPPRTVQTPTTTPAVPEREDIPLVAAPVEAPPTIGPESGLEGLLGQRRGTPPEGEGVATTSGIAGGTGLAPAGLPPPPKVVRIGGNIAAPKLIEKVDPRYPLMAERARIGGVVVLEANVDVTGRVKSVRALRAHPFLEQAAIDAVRQWRYEPLMLNGVPTPFILTVTVSFSTN